MSILYWCLQKQKQLRYTKKRSLAIDPNDVYALNNKGFTLYNLGQYEEAIRYFDKVLAIDPNNALATRNKQLATDNLG